MPPLYKTAILKQQAIVLQDAFQTQVQKTLQEIRTILQEIKDILYEEEEELSWEEKINENSDDNAPKEDLC